MKKHKKNKLVFNLSLKDLKDLGIIKKKRKRKKKMVKKSLEAVMGGVKSSNSHMPPYSFMNMNNLQSENLRLQNDALIEKAKPQPDKEENQLVVANPQLDRVQQLEERLGRTESHQTFTNQLFGSLYNSMYSQPERSRFTESTTVEIEPSNIHWYDPTDSNDVSATGGDETFQNAYGVTPEQVKQDESKQTQKEAVVDDSKASGGGLGLSSFDYSKFEDPSLKSVYEAAKAADDALEASIITPQKQSASSAAMMDPDEAQPKEEKQRAKGLRKISKYESKIDIPEDAILADKTRRVLEERKKAYIKLCVENKIEPDVELLRTSELIRITNVIKKQFPDYYKENISRK